MESKRQDILQSSYLFCGLPQQILQNLSQKATILSLKSRQILMEEEIINDKIILIVEGLVKIYKITPDGKEIFIGIEKAGNYLGVLDLDNHPATATIEALTHTKILVLNKKDLLLILQDYPPLWEKLYKITLAKLRDLNKLHSIRLGNNLYDRTYLLLQYLSKLSLNKTVLLSQETIANIVGATRPRVTEVLQKLQKEKKIMLSPKKIKLLA